MTRDEGLALARKFKEILIAEKLPIEEVRLFGSVARNEADEESDIDIAIICPPFLKTKHKENTTFRKARRSLDLRIEPVCLHPQDLANKFFTLAQEVQRYGIAV